MVDKNPIEEAVLIEMGIPLNERDSWRIRHAARRNQLVDYIAEAVVASQRQFVIARQ